MRRSGDDVMLLPIAISAAILCGGPTPRRSVVEPAPHALQSERLVASSGGAAQDMTGDPRVSLSVKTERDTYFVHEPIRLRLRVAVDPAFLSANMLQLFARSLDVPVQVKAPWIEDLPGAQAVSSGESARKGTARSTLALNESVVEAGRAPDDLTGAGRRITLDVELVYSPTAPGKLAIPEALLDFAYATQFEQDFVNGRVAKDRVDAFVRSKPIALNIVPLPDKDRPPEFTGAVGHFKIDADVSSRTVAVGESLKLSLRIEGDGDVHSFAAPPLRELDGFTIYGTLDANEGDRRIITYDIAPKSTAVTEVPSLSFAYFDPSPPASYRTLKTAPIRIDVHRAAEDSSAASPSAPNRASTPSDSKSSGDSASDGRPPALWIALAVPLVVAILIARRIAIRSRSNESRP